MEQRKLIKKTPEWYMMLFVVCCWAYQPLIFDISVFASKFVGSAFDILFGIFMVVVFFKARAVWCKKIKSFDIIFYLLCVMLTIGSIAVFPLPAEKIKDLFVPFFFQVIPLYFVGLFIDINRQKGVIYWVSAVCVVFQFIYFFFFLQKLLGGVQLQGDLIVPAIQTLPHALVVIWYMLKKFNVINLALTIISVVLLLTFSNRGSILCILLFIAVYFFFLTPNKKNVSTRILVLLMAGVVYLFFNQIVLYLFDIFEGLGLSTAFFDRMINEELSDSNGRDNIYNALYSRIINKGVFGSGMGFDRFLLGTYAHNFVLELLLDFGLIVGGSLVICFFALVFRSFLKASTLDEKAFIAILCGRGMIHLLFSGSYIEEGYFFLLIGFCVATLRQSNNNFHIAS